MEGIREAVAALARGMPLRPEPVAAFRALAPLEPGPVAAVDGSHAVVADTGAAWVAAVRAQAVAWPARPAPPAPLRLHATVAAEAQGQLDAAYGAVGAEAPRASSASAWAEALRALAEHEAALAAATGLPAGGLLLLDGAATGLPPGPQALADAVVERAAARGVTVLGVAKRSGVADAAGPVVARLARLGPASCWLAEPAPGLRVARLHARSRHAFRVDGPAEAVGRLLPLCRDAVYLGYPWPLARAHNEVAVTAREAMAAREAVAAEAARQGWPGLLADFHEVLDLNLPR
jgi:hypothetical protein